MFLSLTYMHKITILCGEALALWTVIFLMKICLCFLAHSFLTCVHVYVCHFFSIFSVPSFLPLQWNSHHLENSTTKFCSYLGWVFRLLFKLQCAVFGTSGVGIMFLSKLEPFLSIKLYYSCFWHGCVKNIIFQYQKKASGQSHFLIHIAHS